MSGNYTNNAGQLQKNITLQNLIKLHEEIGSTLDYIGQTTFGDIFDIDIDQTQLFPLAHLSIESASYDTHQLTYSFRLYIMDLVNTDGSNENDVLSDALQSVGDYISLLKNGSTIGSNTYDMENDVRMTDAISCEPFTERFDSQVSGWAANFDITVSFNASACANDTM